MKLLKTLFAPIFLSSFVNAQSLVISEIMADPSPTVGLPDVEYVELYNPSSNPVGLNGWILFDGSSRQLPGKTIPPSGYIIVCANADTLALSSFGTIAGVSSMSLTNTGDKISIRNPQGIAVDSVTYSDTWYSDPDKINGGWSLEKIDLNLNCLLSSNWMPSTNNSGGTPGAINSVNGVYEDNEAPLLLHAYCLDSTHIVLVFNEPLDVTGFSNPNTTSLSTPYSISSASIFDEQGTSVLMNITPPVTYGTIGQLELSGISDCVGNVMDITQKTPFGIKDTIVDKIIINEILFNPKEDGFDFVELYNNGRSVVSVSDLFLSQVSLSTGTPSDPLDIATSERFIYPEQYLVITENVESVSKQYHSSYPYGFQQTPDLPSMNIDEGKIKLLYQNKPLDSVYYHEDFHVEVLYDKKGVSLERIHPDRSSLEPTNWHSASFHSGGATPGKRNSQFAPDEKGLHVIEVFPEIFSPDLDGYHDVLTFRFTAGIPGVISNITIYNHDGVAVFNSRRNALLGTRDYFSWDGINDEGELAAPGIYIALIELFSIQGETQYAKVPFVLAQKM
ncbi:MAG: lamin tail domain-containing protein [Bacteroidota bacterium]